MINTNGSVHGRIIIDNPAIYAITSQEGYSKDCPALTATSLVRE
jgi:hypothetical protein